MNWHDDIVSGRTLLIGFRLDSEGKPIEADRQYRVKRARDGHLYVVRYRELVLDEYNKELKLLNRLN